MISALEVVEPVVDPNNRISFLLDWELTLKCNLDCSYCATGIYGGHDNTSKHPSKHDCFKTVDFMFEYVSLYMKYRIPSLRTVVLNVYGGESLHHPDIVEILQAVQDSYNQKYKSKFHLTVTTTTNAIITDKKLDQIIPWIDEFTVSYHAENSIKQKNCFKNNLLKIKKANKRLKCVILMHPESDLFEDTQQIIHWCEENQIKFLPRQIDYPRSKKQLNYDKPQKIWFQKLYQSKSYNTQIVLDSPQIDDKFDLSATGRACCGGRCLSIDQNRRSRNFFVKNKFTDWYCSVNEFFLFVKQVNGEIFTNKDCKMNHDGIVSPIGNLKSSQKLLDWLDDNLKNGTLPTIKCAKSLCLCGLCAPKAKDFDTFKSIMEKYHT
jgi:pyruvate-formate lyase-activating enzyme